MFERIIEIMLYVMTELHTKKTFSDIDIRKLHQLGFSTREISTALSWLADKFDLGSHTSEYKLTNRIESLRILSDFEKDYFTEEAYAELINLYSLGLINNEHINFITERASMTNSLSINKGILRNIVANLLFSQPLVNMQSNRVVMNYSETIN